MRRCPQCNRLEPDNALLFCRTDGTRLVASDDAEAPTRALSNELSTGSQGITRDTGSGHAATQTLGTSQNLSAPAAVVRRNLKLPILIVSAVLLVALVIGGILSYRHARNSEVAIDSIAVLPFENQSQDPNNEYLSDGLTESIINSLTQLPNLKVIARSSVFRYKGKASDPFSAGKELGVRAVLTGRLIQHGDDVIVSAELIDLRDNKQLWGDQFQRKTADLLTVQRDIARQITGNLRPRLSGEEQNRANRDYTRNGEAYQLYLKGRFYWNKRTPFDFDKAIGYFRQAIDKDPQYALAYSGLADSYALLAVYGGGPPSEWMPQAKAAAQKSLELDDNLAEGHTSLGQILSYYDFDLNGAEREYQRALQLNPNYATAHQWRAENLSTMGRFDEALAEARRALELDPFSLIINRVYADCLVDARRFDEAIVQYRKTIELDPNFPTAHFFLGRAYEAKGMYDQAVAEYTKTVAGAGFATEDLTQMKKAYESGGWRAYLQATLAMLLKREKQGYTPPFVVASAYARLGQKDEAFAYMEKAVAQRDFRASLIMVSFEFDSLRSDPRYADLIARMRLPH